jgi:hypothetical protein
MDWRMLHSPRPSTRAPGILFLVLFVFCSSAATLAEWVFTVLIKAPLLILLSAVSLLQLRGILQFIAAAAAKQAAKNQVGDLLRPYLRELAPVLTGVFGKADSLSFNLTHVLLTAVLLAVLINGGGFVSALAAPLQRQTREMREQVRETRALGHVADTKSGRMDWQRTASHAS